jgi:Ca-activated chloride channel family protein
MNYTFANPYFLLLIFAAIVLGGAVWFLRSKSASPLKASLPLGFKRKSDFFAKMFYFMPLLFRILAIFLLVLALARPQEVSRSAASPASGIDIMICIDTSTSMQALDFDPFDRLEAAKKTAVEFINKRVSDRIGIVVFAANAVLVCPLTLDYRSLLEFLDNVRIGMIYVDGTAVGDAIATGVNHLKESNAKSKIMVLLTDGRNNTGEIANPVLAAMAAKKFGIKIYTIGTAGKGLAKFPVEDPIFGRRYIYTQDDLDEKTLQKIADVTGGKFYRAQNYKELSDIYSEIDSLEKTEFKDPVTLDYSDKYGFFILPALLLLLIEFILKSLVFIRIP